MKIAVDVQYHPHAAVAGCIGFLDWTDEVVSYAATVTSDITAEYEPGSFYKRELPPILELLATLPFRPELVVVDAYVDVGDGKPGLGRRLHEAIHLPVIGVAKTQFPGAPALEVHRGSSARPLYVTAAGLDVGEAAARVRSMRGARIPSLLKMVDRLASHG